MFRITNTNLTGASAPSFLEADMIIDRNQTAGLERLQDPRFEELKQTQEVNEWRLRQYIAIYPNSIIAEQYRKMLEQYKVQD